MSGRRLAALDSALLHLFKTSPGFQIVQYNFPFSSPGYIILRMWLYTFCISSDINKWHVDQ
jgi:hypothetical protein